jgi:hypothetical protein
LDMLHRQYLHRITTISSKSLELGVSTVDRTRH